MAQEKHINKKGCILSTASFFIARAFLFFVLYAQYRPNTQYKPRQNLPINKLTPFKLPVYDLLILWLDDITRLSRQ